MLGPPYALAKQLLSRLGQSTQSLVKLVQGKLQPDIKSITACAATSGNHGRALAWAATVFGCQCRIYMPESTGRFREQQIAAFGATTIRVPETYDDAVACAVRDAERHDYLLVGDGATAASNVLQHIVHGYSTLGEELLSAREASTNPTHLFVPAGSGSLAAAVTARLWMEFGEQRPRVVIVQPHSADSAYQSCLHGSRVASQGNLATLMDGLSVRELSADAWAILQQGTFAFVTIDDESALATLKDFARDDSLAIGETGIAAIAAFSAVGKDPDARQQLGLDEDSRVVLIATEGVTDPGVLNSLLKTAN